MRRTTVATTLLVLLLVCGCARRPDPAPGAEDGPRLVVMIVVDQFRADYLDRFEPLWTGGLARLKREGVWFTSVRHDHAKTHTAPGHASLATGVFPRRHGIIANSWYDPASADWESSIDDSDEPSPVLLRSSTLGDWLRRARPGARVFTVAGKDRVAVMLGGHDADGAFWYSHSRGIFSTSDYYFGRDPAWLTSFNRRRLLDEHLGRLWEPLPVATETLEAVGIRSFDQGPLVGSFPHLLGAADPAGSPAFYGDLYASPWLDEQIERFAEFLIETHDLGGDAVPDLLGVGFSATDLVGHRFGPDSRELLDTLLRLDRTLARLLDFIDERVGLESTLIVLSADHGVAPVPEVQQQLGRAGGRAGEAEILCLQGLSRRLSSRFGDDVWLLPGPFLNPAAMSRHAVSRSDLEVEAERLAKECPSVAEVWTRSELTSPEPPADGLGRMYYNGFDPARGPDLEIQYAEFFVNYRGAASTHGTPYSYDAEVPLIFRAAGLAPRQVDLPVRTIDVAPTVAALLGLPVPEELDGRSLLPLP